MKIEAERVGAGPADGNGLSERIGDRVRPQPSGDPPTSKADIHVTRQKREASRTMDIDH